MKETISHTITTTNSNTEVFDYEKHTGFTKPIWSFEDLTKQLEERIV